MELFLRDGGLIVCFFYFLNKLFAQAPVEFKSFNTRVPMFMFFDLLNFFFLIINTIKTILVDFESTGILLIVLTVEVAVC